jgi:phage baseplate assembly protein W
MAFGEEDIRESLHILLTTTPGERVMLPEYGCPLKSLVFSNFSTTELTELKTMVEHAVLFYEPRIDLHDIWIDTANQADGLVKILLEYTIRATNSRSNMVYPFYFLEGTDISRS